MAWENSVLVVANVTATADELMSALGERAARGACRFVLVVPAGGPGGQPQLDAALEKMRAAGLEHVSGHVGDRDPVVAAMEAFDPMEFDEIVVSTLPSGSSRWLGLDLPRRLGKLTSVPVHHVVSQPRPKVQTQPVADRESFGVLSPLAAAFSSKR
jgi:hypothetical protein